MKTMVQDREGPGISIHRVDELLDELASHSGFSQMSQQPFHKRTKPRAQPAILREIYKEVTPHEAAFLTQIILQDLRPVLHPLPIVNTTLNLLYAGPKSKKCELGLYQTMKSWHMEMPRVYRLCANLDETARAIERGPPYPTSPTLFKPVAVSPLLHYRYPSLGVLCHLSVE
jgi:DNA ligase-4